MQAQLFISNNEWWKLSVFFLFLLFQLSSSLLSCPSASVSKFSLYLGMAVGGGERDGWEQQQFSTLSSAQNLLFLSLSSSASLLPLAPSSAMDAT